MTGRDLGRVSLRAAVPCTVIAGLALSCGARSELIVGDAEPAVDAVDVHDALINVRDVLDARDVFDAGIDAPDVPFVPPPEICVDGSVDYVYVVTQQNTLWSFYPPSGVFTPIGTIACPMNSGGTMATPYSMTVDRGGTAYVVFSDGHLYRVSTATAQCERTPFTLDQHGFLTFGMGYTADRGDPGETLYVAESDFMGPSQGLAHIDTTTFVLHVVGPFSSTLGRTELSGTGDGRLFGFSLNSTVGSTLSEIDPSNANVISSTSLALGNPDDAFAFAFWDNDFYIFTSPGGATNVSRYRPSDGSLVTVSSMGDTIVGAGVSTCAPH